MWSERGNAARTITMEAEPFRYRPAQEGSHHDHSSPPEGWANEAEDPATRAKQQQDDAFERGKQQGAAQSVAAAQAEVAGERAKVLRTLENFKEERAAYFSRIEVEVVQLSLAIARKILHREAQIDPLLLTGMVHVALEKLDAGSLLRMRAHPQDIRLWTEYFAQAGARHVQIELIGDAALRRGECVLETESGTTLMSLEGQLKEIEQGFLDLLEQRPPVS